jgi:LysM repeat protein
MTAARLRTVCGGATALLLVLVSTAAAAEPLPLDDFSPGFLGIYRKVMEIEDDIRRHSERYTVDLDLARAVCMYESGGNPDLASHAGAQGYFQVMPATFRELNVRTNIEAGVKYLGQLVRQFGREDRAVAAYNGGPGRVGRGGSLPLETLQYVIGVGEYRTLLKQHDASLRYHAAKLRLAPVRRGDDWLSLEQRLGLSALELRLHNPFLAQRTLREGQQIAYPPEPRAALVTAADGRATYRMRLGDHYIQLAMTLGLEVEALRGENGLWHTQVVPPGLVLRLPTATNATASRTVAIGGVGESTRGRPSGRPSPPPRVHRVQKGDTLAALAQRYGTTVVALQRANDLRHTTIRVGQSLRVPAAATGG